MFCLGFCSIVWFFAPENVPKKFSSRQVCCFGGFVLFLFAFLSSSPFRFLFFVVFFQERKLRANRTHPTRTLCSCFFLVFVPAAPGLSPVLAVRPFFLAYCRGAILGPGAFWRFLGFSRYCGGLEITRPLLRPFSRTRGGKGACCRFSFCLVLFFPLLCCLRLHFLLGPSRCSDAEVGKRRVITPAPRESDPQGMRHRARGLWTPPD